MIVRFVFGYGVELQPDQIIALHAAGVTPPIELRGGDGADKDQVRSWTEHRGDLTRVLPILNGAEIIVKGVEDLHALEQLSQKLDRLADRFDRVSSEPGTYVNNRVDVHVPGNALLAIDDIDVRYDCCTDELRELLEHGWRIVAVCPQPDQRRPDYVLGRRRPLDDVDGMEGIR